MNLQLSKALTTLVASCLIASSLTCCSNTEELSTASSTTAESTSAETESVTNEAAPGKADFGPESVFDCHALHLLSEDEFEEYFKTCTLGFHLDPSQSTENHKVYGFSLGSERNSALQLMDGWQFGVTSDLEYTAVVWHAAFAHEVKEYDLEAQSVATVAVNTLKKQLGLGDFTCLGLAQDPEGEACVAFQDAEGNNCLAVKFYAGNTISITIIDREDAFTIDSGSSNSTGNNSSGNSTNTNTNSHESPTGDTWTETDDGDVLHFDENGSVTQYNDYGVTTFNQDGTKEWTDGWGTVVRDTDGDGIPDIISRDSGETWQSI